MKIAIILNYFNEKIINYAKELTILLKNNGHEIWLHKQMKDKIFDVNYVQSHDKLKEKVDIFFALGGDGTIIHTASHSDGKPILGINMGRIGYLANFEYSETEKILTVISSDFDCEERMLIEIKSGEKVIGNALNDGVISAYLSKLLDFEVDIDDSRFKYRADGLIFSTPTGSTAYALSAGGPVVDSSISCMLFTPICPHSLFNRSIVLSPNTVLKVKVLPKYKEKVILTIDGRDPYEIRENEELSFTASDKKVKLIKGNQKNFFDLVNKKLIVPGINKDI
ncbi:MAG: NAD(+)/NADH kinase [Clostridia bacterium]